MNFTSFHASLLLILNVVKASAEHFPCGVSSKQLEIGNYVKQRIQGGLEAVPHSLPWQVRLGIMNPMFPDFVESCGGTLVESGSANGTDLIVTAAHCLYAEGWLQKFVEPRHLYIIAGAHDFDEDEEPFKISLEAVSVVGHENYDDDEVTNDIALIRLKKEVPYSAEIRPACLPRLNQALPYGQTCVASGWGLLHYSGSPSARLQMSIVQIVSSEECGFDHDPLKQFCVKGKGDVCGGDSGGPLVCPVNGQYTLFGVISFSKYNCSDSVFSSVPFYVDWLKASAQT